MFRTSAQLSPDDYLPAAVSAAAGFSFTHKTRAMTAIDEFEELPQHETEWQVRDRIARYRKHLLAAGYLPLPVNGKKVLIKDWSNITATNAIIDRWTEDARRSLEHRDSHPRNAGHRYRRH